MTEIVFDKTYFMAKINGLRLKLREMEDFSPVKGVAVENVKSAKKSSKKAPKSAVRGA